MAEQALFGLKVLDLTQYIAGPYCTRILAGFGADVIKIERPNEGDGARHIGPFLKDEPGLERSGLFLYLNSNKKSITLNLKSNTGVKIFKELVKDADVVVESFRPGVMGRLDLDYWTLEKINPRLVMTSISNFGQFGPYRDYKSAHLIAWGMSGARYTDGRPGGRPLQVGGWLTHYFAGLHALAGTATALYQRNETGLGQHVDVSMFESCMFLAEYPTVIYSYTGQLHTPVSKPPLGIFACKDGDIGLNVLTQPQAEALWTFLGMPELIENPKFTSEALWRHVGELDEEVRATLAPKVLDRGKDELFQSGAEWRVPLGLVPTIGEILDSPQHKAREFFEEVNHPVIGKVTVPGAPFKLTETPWQLRSPAPLFGQHNEEVYCQRLGYSKEDLMRLRQQGII